MKIVAMRPALIIMFFGCNLVPSVPTNVSLVAVSSTELRLSWETPSNRNGVISAYYITWKIVRNDTNHTVDGPMETRKIEETTLTVDTTKSLNISKLGKHYLFRAYIFKTKFPKGMGW